MHERGGSAAPRVVLTFVSLPLVACGVCDWMPPGLQVVRSVRRLACWILGSGFKELKVRGWDFGCRVLPPGLTLCRLPGSGFGAKNCRVEDFTTSGIQGFRIGVRDGQRTQGTQKPATQTGNEQRALAANSGRSQLFVSCKLARLSLASWFLLTILK